VEAAEPAQDGQRRVFENASDEHQPFAFAIFGREADSLGNGVVRPANGGLLAVEHDTAAVLGQFAKNNLCQLRPARADQAREPDDFARVDMKAHILMPVAAQAGHPQDLAVCARAPPLDEFGKLAADHEAYDLAIGQLGRGSDRDELAIAQDGHAITQP